MNDDYPFSLGGHINDHSSSSSLPPDHSGTHEGNGTEPNNENSGGATTALIIVGVLVGLGVVGLLVYCFFLKGDSKGGSGKSGAGGGKSGKSGKAGKSSKSKKGKSSKKSGKSMK